MDDAGGVQFLDEVDGLVEVRDAGADHYAVDRGTGLTGLLHQAFSADLQLPQIRVQIQRVELDGAAGFEEFTEFADPPLEDRLGDLSAAGQFSPVPAVGGGGDDTCVDGRRGHAGQQDRRAPGEPGELRRELHRAIGQGPRRARNSTTARRPRGPHRR